MIQENSIPIKTLPKERCQGGRKKDVCPTGDQARGKELDAQTPKFKSLLEIGRWIGLDLQIGEMLLQISQQACEVMEADRCSIFLYDPKTDELWSDEIFLQNFGNY